MAVGVNSSPTENWGIYKKRRSDAGPPLGALRHRETARRSSHGGGARRVGAARMRVHGNCARQRMHGIHAPQVTRSPTAALASPV